VIPALIVPVLNRPDLLDRLLASIHYEVGDLLVIDNGNVVKSLPHIPGVHRSHLIKSPTNLGVPASWNLGIKMLPFATYWMVVNSDAYFPRTSMNRLAAAYRYDALVLSGAAPPWACFMVGQQVVSARSGLFDEGISSRPTSRTTTTMRRCTYARLARSSRPASPSGTTTPRPSTRSPSASRGQLQVTFPVNRAYYEAKVRTRRLLRRATGRSPLAGSCHGTDGLQGHPRRRDHLGARFRHYPGPRPGVVLRRQDVRLRQQRRAASRGCPRTTR
jgi:hypothetical protein